MVENGEKGLLAYCVHPGAVRTRLAESMPRDTLAGKLHLIRRSCYGALRWMDEGCRANGR